MPGCETAAPLPDMEVSEPSKTRDCVGSCESRAQFQYLWGILAGS